jgi:hypothetical protein
METTKFDIRIVTKGCRSLDFEPLLRYFRAHTFKFWSWGAKDFATYNDLALYFSVNGHHHKGKVCITLNFMDLFDVYLIDESGNIKTELKDVYLEDLFNIMDVKIEKIPAYKY